MFNHAISIATLDCAVVENVETWTRVNFFNHIKICFKQLMSGDLVKSHAGIRKNPITNVVSVTVSTHSGTHYGTHSGVPSPILLRVHECLQTCKWSPGSWTNHCSFNDWLDLTTWPICAKTHLPKPFGNHQHLPFNDQGTSLKIVINKNVCNLFEILFDNKTTFLFTIYVTCTFNM